MGEENVATYCRAHNPVQHRDGKPKWCDLCGLTEDGHRPISRFEKNKAEVEMKPPAHTVIFENHVGNELVCSCGEAFRSSTPSAFIGVGMSATQQWAIHYKESLPKED